MKKIALCFLLLPLTILLTQCKVSNLPEGPEQVRVYTSLADYLNTKSNVIVKGLGDNITLQVRGINSINGDTRPFIYVDDIGFGRSYANVNKTLDPNNIKSVRVLSSLSELSLYGENGNSGIILIYTKNK